MNPKLLAKYQQQFTCKFPAAIDSFSDCLEHALKLITEDEITAYLQGANFLCSIGQGVEPVLVYMRCMPRIIAHFNPDVIEIITNYSYQLARSPNKKALIPFLHSLKGVCARIDTIGDLQTYLKIIDNYVDKTQTVIHGHQSIHASPGMIALLESIPKLIFKLSLSGIENFIHFGASNYKDAPEQQIEYFKLASHDAKSIIARERIGINFRDVEHKLLMAKDSLWQCDLPLVAFNTDAEQISPPQAYLDDEVIALPDIYTNKNGISGLNRYRATLAHLMAHKKWSTKLMADNYAPQLQLMVSVFEDARVDTLAMRLYPGLKKYFLALHPYPKKDACDNTKMSCLRYRATRLSRALIDVNFDAQDDLIADMCKQFTQLLANGSESSTKKMSDLGTKYYIKSRCKSDSLPEIYFTKTQVSYRDDNRYLWFHYEEYDEADEIIPNEYQNEEKRVDSADSLPPRYYHEWDYLSNSYKPDWAKVYERLHASGNAKIIDGLLEKHSELAKRLKSMIEILKPQHKKRIRFQEEGAELDLDIALRSLIDLKSGHVPDMRINYSHTTDNRDIAVMLLVDMSESLNNTNQETGQTLLELSQEALAITAWTIDSLGDKFAIAGFNSDTRAEVRYQHIKGFSENYDNTVKARIAKMQANYSTRMGAAMRHAAHYLSAQKCAKKIMLILTDGEPADIDVKDPQALIKDCKKAVAELQTDGIYSYCITLDKDADDYVEDIFSHNFIVIDHISRLPELLPQVFMQLSS